MKIVKLALLTLCAGGLVAGTTCAQSYGRTTARPASFDYDAYYAQDSSPQSPSDQPVPQAQASDAGCNAAAACNGGCDSCGGCGCDKCCDHCDGLFDPCCTVGEPWTLFEKCECGPVIGGWIDQGYTWNPSNPVDRLNFGRLFDDRSNDYQLNQIVLNIEKALDPNKACCAHWGYKLELLYGSDARFIHYTGILDNVTDQTVQPAIVEAYLAYHAPILSDGGVDFKFGNFVTLHGAEVINAPGNPLYSHSYMFNFGIPFLHTGVMSTWHVNSQLDVMAGLVTGINTGYDDNNDVLAFHGGVTFKSSDGKSTLVVALHSGAENASNYAQFGADPNHDLRNIVDAVLTFPVTDKLTSITDFNVGRDEAPLGLNGTQPEWYGVCQYFKYQTSDCTTWVVRGEIFRDDDGFVVFKDPANDGFINAQQGVIPNSLIFGGADTYYELTFGCNYKWNANVLLRPEVRWDWADNTTPFDNGTRPDQFTAGFDVIMTF